MTTTTTTPARGAVLRSVPTTATPSPRAARVATPEPVETPAERVAMCARAADDAGATAEHAAELLRTVRLALLGGHRGAAHENAAGAITQLSALARLLGELHGELDELAEFYGPERGA